MYTLTSLFFTKEEKCLFCNTCIYGTNEICRADIGVAEGNISMVTNSMKDIRGAKVFISARMTDILQ